MTQNIVLLFFRSNEREFELKKIFRFDRLVEMGQAGFVGMIPVEDPPGPSDEITAADQINLKDFLPYFGTFEKGSMRWINMLSTSVGNAELVWEKATWGMGAGRGLVWAGRGLLGPG